MTPCKSFSNLSSFLVPCKPKVEYVSATLWSLIGKQDFIFKLDFVWSYLVFKMYEDKKTEKWNNECIAQFNEKMHCQVSPLSYTSNTKTILP